MSGYYFGPSPIGGECPPSILEDKKENRKVSVTVFRQSTILDRFTIDELLQVCHSLEYAYKTTDWNSARVVVGNLLLDKGKRVFKDQGGIINIIDR